MNKELEKLNPFEKTVLLELAKTQAMASATFQIVCGAPASNAKDILDKSLDATLQGLLETLKKNQ
jgi:hypothetical protein